MATKKITGIPEIDLIASSLSKKFGKDSILTMGPKYEKVETIPTGSISLDQCLGVGGIPNDRIIEIFGPPSAGKTSLTYKSSANMWLLKGMIGPLFILISSALLGSILYAVWVLIRRK